MLGEHTDWAGGASLAVPLPQGIEVTVEEPAGPGLLVRSALDGRLLAGRFPTDGAVDVDGGPLRFVGAAAFALTEMGVDIPPAELWVTADLPAGRGFSSSAAFNLAILDALARHAGHPLPAATLAELAFSVEHDLLGVPCGRLDPLACVAGTPVFLQWTRGRAPLRRVHLGAALHLVVGALSRPRNTGAILSALQDHFFDRADPPDPLAVLQVREALSCFGSLAEAGALALEAGDIETLGAAMNQAQDAYDAVAERLRVLQAPALNRARRALAAAGALGSKFSGAGGDGSVIAAFADAPAAEAAATLLQADGLNAWALRLEDS